jgi:sigma-B regulation protein RsbU (phosphoserine phosphatase)
VEPLRDAAGLPLGVNRKVDYHHKWIEIEPGDLVLLYSDGLIAAQNDQAQMFGWERLDDALRNTAQAGAEAVKLAVLGELEDFLDRKDPEDDVTLLVIERSC